MTIYRRTGLGVLHTHRMGLGVEHKGVLVTFLDLPLGICQTLALMPRNLLGRLHTFCVDEVAVLHNLGEEEALLVVVLGATVFGVDVCYGCEARVGTGGSIDRHKSIPHPVTVLWHC